MWYVYLRRDQQYMRSHQTHNLWLNQYHEKMRLPKIQALHIAFFKKMAKSYSGVSFTLIGLIDVFCSPVLCPLCGV
jgi:hypothetical protein